ncbi:hypothetical protein SLS63_008641 [Diaporthe eres]|uniref:Uncharacterized protein n=1 Tax=Diaporthe eres TaxID=83184 RepID=A0ABR1P278_DIAER
MTSDTMDRFNSSAEAISLVLQDIARTQAETAQLAQSESVKSLTTLINVLLDLANFIKGDYDDRAFQSAVRQGFKDLIYRLHDAAQASLDVSVRLTDRVASFELNVNDISDTELGPLKSEVEAFRQRQTDELVTLNNQIRDRSAALQTQLNSMAGLQEQLAKTRQEYEDAKQSANNMQVGDSCGDLERVADQVQQSIRNTQGLVNSDEADLVEKKSAQMAADSLLTNLGPVLLTIDHIRGFANTLQGSLNDLKIRMQSVEISIGRMLASAKSVEFSPFNKSEIATSILDILDRSLVDIALLPLKAQVVSALQNTEGAGAETFLAGLASGFEKVSQDEKDLISSSVKQASIMRQI